MTTLLAVDDSNTMQKVLEITFAGEDDLEALIASGPEEALQLVNERRPSVAVIDAKLGDSDGYALCERIKREHAGTLVLLLSSKQNPYDSTRGAAAGVDAHVDKPFDTQALIDRVRALAKEAPPPALHRPVPAVVEPEAPSVPSPVQPVAAPALVTQEPEAPAPPAPPFAPSAPAPVAAASSDGAAVAAAFQAPTTPAEPRDPTTAPPPPEAPAPSPAIPVAPSAAISAAATNGLGALNGKLQALGLTGEQAASVLALSKEIIEQAVWEVVPTLAETLIKEEIARLTKE